MSIVIDDKEKRNLEYNKHIHLTIEKGMKENGSHHTSTNSDLRFIDPLLRLFLTRPSKNKSKFTIEFCRKFKE